MRERDELVEVAETVWRLREHDDVVRAFLQMVGLYEVAFHAVDDLEVGLAVLEGLGRVRERLHNAVVGDGNGRPAPAVSGLDEVLDGDDGVHAAHRRMGMELDALDLGMVLARLDFFLGHAVDEQHVFVHVGIKADRTARTHGHALFDLRHDGIVVLLLGVAAALFREELLAGDAVRVVGDAERQKLRARLELDGAKARARAFANRALDDDVLHLARKLLNLMHFARNTAAKDELAEVRDDDGRVRVGVFAVRPVRSGFLWLSLCFRGLRGFSGYGCCISFLIIYRRRNASHDRGLVLCFGRPLGFGAFGLDAAQGFAVLGVVEAVVDFKVLQDFLAGLAVDAAAVAEHPFENTGHDLRDGVRAHDFAAELARHVDGDMRAVDRVFRAFEQLIDGRIALRRLVDELRPDFAERVLDIDDVLIKDTRRELALLRNLVASAFQELLRNQRLRRQRDFPAVRMRADLHMADCRRLQESFLLLRQAHPLHQLPEHILLARDNPELLHRWPSFLHNAFMSLYYI